MENKRYTLDKVISHVRYARLSNQECLYIWVTRDAQMIPLMNLRDNHLDNIIDRFKEMPQWRKEQQPYIYAEKRRRIEQAWASKTQAGKVLYGRT